MGRGSGLCSDAESEVAKYAVFCQLGGLRSFLKKEQNYEWVIKKGQKYGTILLEVR